jgi:putative PIN family toxin of toxin-antitoxin system
LTSDPLRPTAAKGRTGLVVVLDTNIVLDLFVFQDPATATLRQRLESGEVRWIATSAMREELERVLGYPQITPRLAFHQTTPAQVLAQFDQCAQTEPAAARASAVCKDPDDQCFIDLAVAHRARLLSKDGAVLCMSKRLLALGVITKSAI